MSIYMNIKRDWWRSNVYSLCYFRSVTKYSHAQSSGRWRSFMNKEINCFNTVRPGQNRTIFCRQWFQLHFPKKNVWNVGSNCSEICSRAQLRACQHGFMYGAELVANLNKWLSIFLIQICVTRSRCVKHNRQNISAWKGLHSKPYKRTTCDICVDDMPDQWLSRAHLWSMRAPQGKRHHSLLYWEVLADKHVV